MHIIELEDENEGKDGLKQKHKVKIMKKKKK